MTEYIEKLKTLVVDQVNRFITKVMRPEDADYDKRRSQLLEKKPDDESGYVSTESATQALVSPSNSSVITNNHPLYPVNIIDKTNTPFDYIDRIYLQDFSTVLNSDDSSDNYFKNAFSFSYREDEDYGIKSITLYGGNPSLERNWDGQFFLESFTYTPFIDFATKDTSVGIYSDETLTKYNQCYYDVKENFVDENRGQISSNLYQLRNLDDDLYEAKVSFREAVENTDEKTFIYTFCEHIMSLFAKLSNVRMCHEIYGLKPPHTQWEGILALDIWYQLLYRNIDSEYAFDDKLMGRNPMVKLQLLEDSDGKYVEYFGEKVYFGKTRTDGLKLMTNGVEDGYGLLWDNSLWETFDETSKTISERRKECVLPRGVLNKIYEFVNDVIANNDLRETVLGLEDGDFSWFKQTGKTYSDSSKSKFSRYVNLHLGRAYEVMSASEYHQLNDIPSEGGFYVKPTIDDAASDIRYKMLYRGYGALVDAFRVLNNEHIFNIYNSQTKCVEEFVQSNRNNYSQAQCAIVIERIFSRIYRYLNFKSTTCEYIQKRINIDSGYKYLTTDSILSSDNGNSNAYFDENDEVPYLRYLNKLSQYLDENSDVLDDDEKTIVGHAISILSQKSQEWMQDEWNLCPLCQTKDINAYDASTAVESASSRNTDETNSRDVRSGNTVNRVYVDLNFSKYMDVQAVALPSSVTWYSYGKKVPSMAQYDFTDSNTSFNLSSINIFQPTFTYGDKTLTYKLLGYSTSKDSRVCTYGPNVQVDRVTIVSDNSVLTLYAVWESKYIVEFNRGMNPTATGSMELQEVPSGTATKLNKCGFVDGTGKYQFTYYDNDLWASVESNDRGDNRQINKFDHWEYTFNSENATIQDNGSILIPEGTSNTYPVVTLYATWTTAYNSISFYVGGHKYCDSLVDVTTNQLVYPIVPPVMKGTEKVFIGWDMLPGSVLSGIDVSENLICGFSSSPIMCGSDSEIQQIQIIGPVEYDTICGQGTGPIVCVNDGTTQQMICSYADNGDMQFVCNKPDIIVCGTEDSNKWKKYIVHGSKRKSSIDRIVWGYEPDRQNIICEYHYECEDPVVCYNEGFYEYNIGVNAQVADNYLGVMTITFIYIDSNGNVVRSFEQVNENQTIPQFHIHDTIDNGDGTVMKFRYWKLESGNITSSLTILSDVVLCAVYDKVEVDTPVTEEVEEETVILSPMEQTEQEELGCQYVSEGVNGDGNHYCTFTGGFPRYRQRDYANDNEIVTLFDKSKVYVNCPILNLMNVAYSEENDFGKLTIMEISDVETLLNALFKVNIDIAHNEYFLREEFSDETGWWYGYILHNGKDQIVCERDETQIICGGDTEPQLICSNPDATQDAHIVCKDTQDQIICGEYDELHGVVSDEVSNQIVCNEYRYISFEPTVEFKFSNLHASNQVQNDKLMCTFNEEKVSNFQITPVNRELIDDDGIHYSDYMYCYDYSKSLKSLVVASTENEVEEINTKVEDNQKYYDIVPLHLYEDSDIQSPTDVNGFVKHRIEEIDRSISQVRTFTSIVKKYRPMIVPEVRDIFNDCVNDYTKYEVDQSNAYGVFGWCTIPSKTMVNMEYNEHSIIVPSSYDHHNRVSGSDFLQMDSDFDAIYNGNGNTNISNTWYYLYDSRDWTYFMMPFFNIGQNNGLYSYMLGSYDKKLQPANSNHINGVIYETSNISRDYDSDFGNIVEACGFLASHHHGEKNLNILSQKNILSYAKLKELTISNGSDQFNSMYGSKYEDLPQTYRYLKSDSIDDYDKTSSYVGLSKYEYNLGQRDSIDDGDEDSVWLYITMSTPRQDVDNVIEVTDIMPFVFWWSNRGSEGNGPTVDCYGLKGSPKRNFDNGYCYESPMVNGTTEEEESRWHTVKHTLGIDFSKEEYGNAIVTQDNSGNVFKGAFDPTCTGTDEKWKVHHQSNSFGANQHEDPSEDKYHIPCESTGESGGSSTIDESLNTDILESLDGKPMTWNLWNVIRHYAYIRYFKSNGKSIEQKSDWDELESHTETIVRGIYRTFRQNCGLVQSQNTFSQVDGLSSNDGEDCELRWTNSFVQVQTVFERNAREHNASFVLFTGHLQDTYESNTVSYLDIRNNKDNFVVTTLDGIDNDDDGMMPRTWSQYEDKWIPDGGVSGDNVYQGHKHSDMPFSFIIGGSSTYNQSEPDVDIQLSEPFDFDTEYPYSEYHKDDTTQKWNREMSETVMTTQILPVYTSMETLIGNDGRLKTHHELTVKEMKSITFSIIPQLYWKYEEDGSKPEPERFCAWRISKMMFGVEKDTEYINNVYELN